MSETVRLDKWLWAARFFKTRGLAREAVAGGKVQIENRRVKPGGTLTPGDRLTIRRGEEIFQITVLDLSDRRVGASLAATRYEEDAGGREQRLAEAEQRRLQHADRPHPPRRPGKRERRQIISLLRGRDPD